MEKIININTAGRVIAIEDGAYTSLKTYLESLRNLFAGEEGSDEIINDIESRIAELMDEKIKRGSAAINEADVAEIIAGMGRVEDFAAAEEDTYPQDPPRASSGRKRAKRFYRDTNDKLLGGVCSGLASYLDVDPALIRIVFAILTLGGWGTGLLLYIALWIFVPSSPLESYRGRRLFRDAEDKWLGGVCSGIAAYFDKEVWMFRVLFALPFILSVFSGSLGFFIGAPLFFGSFTGTFFLIYIVLWIVLPVATTDFQKMEMRGEKVDLASIRENVMADIKDRAKTFGGEVSESASRLSNDARQFVSTRGRQFAQEASNAGRPLVSRGAHVIGTLLKIFFVFVGSAIAFSLFTILIGYSFGGFSGLVNDFIMRTPAQRSLGWATVILFFGVPLLGLVTFIVRRVLRIRNGGKYFAWGYSALWIAGWFCLVFLASSLRKEFQRSETITQEMSTMQPMGSRLIITVPDQPIEYSGSLPWLHGDIQGWDVADGVMHSARVMVVTALSPDSMYHVVLKRSAMGTNKDDAAARAGRLAYSLRSASDSVLQLDNGYAITKQEGYRAQNVIVEIQVPAGKRIRFDKSVDEKLLAFNIPFRQRYRYNHKGWEAGWDEHRIEQDWEPGIDYTMNVNGDLLDTMHPEKDGQRVPRRWYDKTEWDENTSGTTDRKLDSLERAMDALEREKERLEEASDD